MTTAVKAPRVPLPEPGEMTGRQREVYDTIVSGPRGRLVGPLRAVLLAPELADRWQRFGQYLRYETSVPLRINELAIIVTARRWNSQVEWQVHAAAAAAAGLPRAVIEEIRWARLPTFDDPADAEAYEFARQLLTDGDVDDGLHARLVDRWGAPGVVELTSVIGYYTMVSMMLNAQAIPPIDSPEPLLEPLPGGPGGGRLTAIPALPQG